MSIMKSDHMFVLELQRTGEDPERQDDPVIL